ncbi:hypothetical protein WV31_14865 [Magnetospirillum sp. ME-1]|nr:hypothetical protein WV31_14865 [Magnetospirillum sp. ME-1]
MDAAMDKDLRHCLPDRIRAIVGLLSHMAASDSIAPLIADGCRCAEERPCILWDACKSIHRAFQTDIH